MEYPINEGVLHVYRRRLEHEAKEGFYAVGWMEVHHVSFMASGLFQSPGQNTGIYSSL